MGKQTKSQWDFGELFPREAASAAPALPAARKVLTVAELTAQVKRLLESQVGQIWVTGEVTNLRAQSSGHLYFTLKDAESQLNCVLFRSDARESRQLLQDGRKVVLQGELTVYEPRGQYQLRVTTVELQGLGALQAAFEKLKAKLDAEGLFAPGRKRPLPRYPQRLGIATSPTGAAIRDVLHVIQRRHSSLELILAPCRVQGQGAAGEIASAIRLLNEFNRTRPNAESRLDLILVTRGGGSLEDLWAFNEEAVARAIFESDLPVVSAVGHEIDFTISDFVADFRAATPSAAAEIITDGVYSSIEFVAAAAGRMGLLLRRRLADNQYETNRLAQRLARAHPRRRLDEWLQLLDDQLGRIARCAMQGLRERRIAWRHLAEGLTRARPVLVIERRREALGQVVRRLQEATRHQLQGRRSQWSALEGRLRLLGPEQVLARGYSITLNAETGRVIRSRTEAKPGQRLRTRLQSGEVSSRVEE